MNLFGVDIAQAIYDGFQGQLKTGTLTRRTETYDPVTDETTINETPHEFEGFVDTYSKRLIADGVVQANDREIMILAKSLDVAPTNGSDGVLADLIEIDGQTFTTIEVERDPAGATYRVQGKL